MASRPRSSSHVVLFGCAIAVAVAVGWFVAKRSVPQSPEGTNPVAVEGQGPLKRAAHLYFGDHQGRHLVSEQRIMVQPADSVDFCRQLVQALIDGPRQGGSRTLPADATINAVFALDKTMAVVDFGAQSFARHPGGVGTELLAIYSIVDTLTLNVEAIRSVKILIGGREAATLAGHVDISLPFTANMLWVR